MSLDNKDLDCLIAVPTLRRPLLLPRVLACFDRLNYENKRMIIINDDPDTKLIYDKDPRVEIINIDKQLQLSVKRNMFHSWNYDIIFPLDDDDLFMPDRLSNHVEAYRKSFFSIDLFRNTACYSLYHKKLKIDRSSSFTNSSFTRAGFFKSTGYTAFNRSNFDDQSLDKNFRKNCVCHEITDILNIDYIYDFNGVRYHNTFNNDVIMNSNLLKRTESERKQSGTIILEPDYQSYDIAVKLCKMLKEGDSIPIEFINHGATFIKALE